MKADIALGSSVKNVVIRAELIFALSAVLKSTKGA